MECERPRALKPINPHSIQGLNKSVHKKHVIPVTKAFLETHNGKTGIWVNPHTECAVVIVFVKGTVAVSGMLLSEASYKRTFIEAPYFMGIRPQFTFPRDADALTRALSASPKKYHWSANPKVKVNFTATQLKAIINNLKDFSKLSRYVKQILCNSVWPSLTAFLRWLTRDYTMSAERRDLLQRRQASGSMIARYYPLYRLGPVLQSEDKTTMLIRIEGAMAAFGKKFFTYKFLRLLSLRPPVEEIALPSAPGESPCLHNPIFECPKCIQLMCQRQQSKTDASCTAQEYQDHRQEVFEAMNSQHSHDISRYPVVNGKWAKLGTPTAVEINKLELEKAFHLVLAAHFRRLTSEGFETLVGDLSQREQRKFQVWADEKTMAAETVKKRRLEELNLPSSIEQLPACIRNCVGYHAQRAQLAAVVKSLRNFSEELSEATQELISGHLKTKENGSDRSRQFERACKPGSTIKPMDIPCARRRLSSGSSLTDKQLVCPYGTYKLGCLVQLGCEPKSMEDLRDLTIPKVIEMSSEKPKGPPERRVRIESYENDRGISEYEEEYEDDLHPLEKRLKEAM